MYFSVSGPNRKSFSFLRGKALLSSYALAGCLFLYALQGSPTPDNPGLVELLIALLLLLSIGVVGFTSFLSERINTQRLSSMIFFVFGLTVPIVIGLMRDASLTIILRDVAAFALLCLPLFMMHNLGKSRELSNVLLYGCCVIALVFSARVLFADAPFLNSTGELLYLANSPLVLFFAIFMLGMAYQQLFKLFNIRAIIVFFLLCAGAIFILFAMLQDVQRATLLAVFISLAYLVYESIIRQPKRAVLPMLILCGVLIAALPTVKEIFMAIDHKTNLVGFNSRTQELSAVWKEVGGTFSTAFFGMGWGSQFESPALGGLKASFTHSLLSYMLLKTGMVGLFMTLFYCAVYMRQIIRIFFVNRVVGIALFWSFVIPIFLYASYKSFDFGLLLTLITAFALYSNNNEKTVSSDY